MKLLAFVLVISCSSPSSPTHPQPPKVSPGDAAVASDTNVERRRRDAGALPVPVPPPVPSPDAGTSPVPVPAPGPAPVRDASVIASDAAVPHPVIADAAVALPLSTMHPFIYLGTQGQRLKTGLAKPAGVRWRAAVDRWLGGADLWGFNAWNGALLGALTGEVKYCAKAVALIDKQVTEAEAKIAAGTAPEVAHDSNLGIGEMVGDLALVYDWCFAQVTATQRSRWIAYANQAVWNVWNPTIAKWGTKTFPWTGWSVNNPSNNYYYSFLRATMLLGLATKGENSQAAAWITKFHDEKILGQLVPTFDRDLIGGGSREGTGYGVAQRRLWELYDFWKASTGEDLANRTGHARASMLTMIHQILPTLDRVAPTGDHTRDATGALFDYHRDYLLQLMALYPADGVSARARALLDASTVPQMTQVFMYSYDFLYDPTVAPKPLDLPLVHYAPGIGEVYARSSWKKDATWMNMIAGPYTESHAHQDQGSLMLYRGAWLAHDANIHSKSGLAQGTSAHSLVRIDSGGIPIKQAASTTSQVLALHKGSGYVFVSVDVTAAYKNAVITKVRRQLLWIQPDIFVVRDHVISGTATTQTWQLVTPVAPVISGATATITNGAKLRVQRIEPTVGTWTIYNYRDDATFTGGFRLDASYPGGDRTYLHVLSIDSAPAAVARAGGVDLMMPDGTKMRVVFDDVGATMTIGGVDTKLTAGIDAP